MTKRFPGIAIRRRSRRYRSLRASLTVALGAALVPAGLLAGATAAQAAPAPAEDPFYTPPAPLPAGQPGTVIRSRQSSFSGDSKVKSWQVLYRSESATGAPIAVSGTVLVPGSAWSGSGPRPLVSYGVGTRGLGDGCAPSYTLTPGGFDYESGFINDALKKGWAVAVTDMQGLGTPGVHTYEVGRAQGKAVLDITRAAQRLPGTGLTAANPVGLLGYSQGGTSAGWAAELAPSYAPELALKGMAAGGVPADLTAVARGLDGGFAVAFAFMAAVGYDTAYPELNLSGYLNDAGRKLLATSQSMCLVSIDGVANFLGTAFKRISDYTTSDPLATPAWQRRLGENKLGSTAPTVPVFMGHGQGDQIIPFAQAEQLRRDWCGKNVNVTWKTYPMLGHAFGMLFAQPDALTFLADRFAGTPVRGNC
ncbi:triacylglycerol lipase [Actinomadura craniellae]|uniref:Triacylglycerol lipase n=1 Tax=Actinomadura craniellae TaxID=2231787 RepID=A0A365HAY1_9ACTN|nr:lipase family protein [Actinomadura craniellae]RAY16300.1 triacylglycerol lipase [Actinomadura craniellae]